MRRFKGFTLTELMVALAVIGIIVAIVTPAIVRMRPNKNKMMVKKTFYTTEQIVSTLINDQRFYPDVHLACDLEEGSVEESDDYYCAWGFDYDNKVRHEGEDYEGDDKFAGLFKSMLNVKSVDSQNDNIVYTNDGVKWDLSPTVTSPWTKGADKPSDSSSYIEIDVNGDEEPNYRESDDDCSSEDFDTYRITIYANGKLQIDEDDEKAIEYATINTSIRDSIQ